MMQFTREDGPWRVMIEGAARYVFEWGIVNDDRMLVGHNATWADGDRPSGITPRLIVPVERVIAVESVKDGGAA